MIALLACSCSAAAWAVPFAYAIGVPATAWAVAWLLKDMSVEFFDRTESGE